MARSLLNSNTVTLFPNHLTFVERTAHPPNKNSVNLQLRFPASLNRRFRSTLSMSLSSVNQPQKVVVVNDHSEKLVGLLHDTGSKDVVIVCHGFTGRKEHKMMVNICGALEKEGISAYRFDFSGNGESDGTFAYGNYMKEVEDVRAVVKHFNEENRTVSAIVGHSKGGDTVLLYASKYHDIHTVVNLSGRYDLKKGIAERLGEDFMERIKKDGYIDVECQKTGKLLYRVTEESLVERLSTDMHEAALRINKNCRAESSDNELLWAVSFMNSEISAPLPVNDCFGKCSSRTFILENAVLTVHGSADEVIPVEDAYEFSKIIPNHRLHIIEGANHCFTEHQDELVPVVIDFIKSCMQQDNESSG